MFALVARYYKMSAKPHANLEHLKTRWGREFLKLCKIRLHIKGDPKSIPQQAFIVGNHISYVDIPLLMSLIPNSCFVSKAEVGNWPIIGPATTRAGTVYVQRNSPHSRRATMDAMKKTVVEDKKRIILFPSGTTSLKSKGPWKRGIFNLAAETGIPIFPLRISYEPMRRLAYIDDDSLFPHLMQVASQGENHAYVEFGEMVYIKDAMKDTEKVRAWCEGHL
jgi:1-acyl-sn-glycerol-3-phosphate acyltransferase